MSVRFNDRIPKLYYLFLINAFFVSITVCSVVFSLNADALSRYQDGDVFNPLRIHEFFSAQLQNENSRFKESVSLSTEDGDDQKWLKTSHIIVVDRTASGNVAADQKEYSDDFAVLVKSEIDNYYRSTALGKKLIDSIKKLQFRDALALFCATHVFDTWKEAVTGMDSEHVDSMLFKDDEIIFSNVGVLFYEGDGKGLKHIQEGATLHDNFFRKKFAKTDVVQSFLSYVDKADLIREDRTQNGKIDTTDFAKLLNGLTGVIERRQKEISGNDHRFVVTIISDFEHENLEDFSGRGVNQVKAELDSLTNTKGIHQLNLVQLKRNMDNTPKKDSQRVADIQKCINATLKCFSKSIPFKSKLYSLNTERMIEMDKKHPIEFLKWICTPAVKAKESAGMSYKESSKHIIRFYYPYRHTINNLTVSNAIFQLVDQNNNPLEGSAIIELKSMDNLNAQLPDMHYEVYNDEVAPFGSGAKELKINDRTRVEFKNGETISAYFTSPYLEGFNNDFLMEIMVQQTESKKSDGKTKKPDRIIFPVEFREKIPQTSILMVLHSYGISLWCLVLWCLVMSYDIWKYSERYDENQPILKKIWFFIKYLFVGPSKMVMFKILLPKPTFLAVAKLFFFLVGSSLFLYTIVCLCRINFKGLLFYVGVGFATWMLYMISKSIKERKNQLSDQESLDKEEATNETPVKPIGT